MKVALYNSHHQLPFWHRPKNPYGIFDSTLLNMLPDWTYKKDEWDEEHYCQKTGPATEHYMLPVLNGLLALNLPGVMAHVSLCFDSNKKAVYSPKRVWVQITTESALTDANGLPVVVQENGGVAVTHLWGGDNGTYTPYQLLGKEPVEGETTPEFWTKFFLDQLREVKGRLQKKYEEAELAVQPYNDLIL